MSSYIFFKEPFEAYISYLAFLLLFPFFFMRYGVPKYHVLLFLPLFISGLVYCAIGFNTYNQFFKVFIGFFSSVLFYHYVIQLFDFNLRLLFRYYMLGCVIVSIIGLFQLASYTVGFGPGYNFTWVFNKWSVTQGGLGIRINSIFSEPAYFAAVVAPAFFVSIYNLSGKNPLFITQRQSIIIAATYLLTFSSVGILGIFITIILLLINLGFLRYSLVFIPLLSFTFTYSYNNVPEFTDRWDGTFEIFSTGNYKSYDIHGSSFVLYNNYHVALENIKAHPFFGTGLGSHPAAFDIYSLTKLENAVNIEFNKMDANSMLLRLTSETGIYGLFVILNLLFRCWVFKQRAHEREAWVMSNAIVLMFLLFLLRQGHYFINGFPFFLWMYYYIARANWNNYSLDGSDWNIGKNTQSTPVPAQIT
ncbi:MAG: hypothetical protein IT223_07340 [Crocinitomicaceae bacterium]|nr:hypothetical protein [Crocinitomicaceae bacterium]